jgi:hypothetical protein
MAPTERRRFGKASPAVTSDDVTVSNERVRAMADHEIGSKEAERLDRRLHVKRPALDDESGPEDFTNERN